MGFGLTSTTVASEGLEVGSSTSDHFPATTGEYSDPLMRFERQEWGNNPSYPPTTAADAVSHGQAPVNTTYTTWDSNNRSLILETNIPLSPPKSQHERVYFEQSPIADKSSLFKYW